MTVLLKFSSFAVVGGLCTLLQYLILYLLVTSLAMSPALASSIGYVISAALNYVLNYHWTFRSTRNHAISISRFAATAFIGLLLNALIMFFGTGPLGLNYLIVQLGATAIVLFWNFMVNLKWSF